MNKQLFYLSLLITAGTGLYGQEGFSSYYHRHRLQMTGPSVQGVGLYGYDHPAFLAYLRSLEIAAWQGTAATAGDAGLWGLAAAGPGFGFNYFREHSEHYTVSDYGLNLAWRLPGSGFGIGYEWHAGDKEFFNRRNLFKAGLNLRPARFASVSGLFVQASDDGSRELVTEIALRPLATDRLTFFADAVRQNFETNTDPAWSAGLALEPLSGLRLCGRYYEDKSFTAGAYLSLGHLAVQTLFHFDETADRIFSSAGIRLGGFDRTFLRTALGRRSKYLGLDLKGEIKYRRTAFFDRSRTFLDLLTIIDRGRRDPVIAGIALNLSGLVINAEQAWELRTQLEKFKAEGKRVVIYLDQAGMAEYHLASIADRIVLDPCGTIMLAGVMHGRYYVRRALDKLGLGVDEWRFFKYKSAAETISRDKMSEADREQWQAIVDDWYELIRHDVCQARGFHVPYYDSLINQQTVFLPEAAVAAGLVDTIGRAEAVEKAIAGLEGRKRAMVGPSVMAGKSAPWDYEWGDLPVIAVVYALGECAMDQGIKARQLSRDIESVTKDRKVRAVVFRVDSPGGDALASDVVAEALRKCSAKKPVIVTQGSVAGSGGYWISMYGDTILAAPHTLTGSIGVIGFWLYDQGFNEKTGVTTDKVQAGEHADLGYGFSYPFIGMLPDRNLTPDERQKMESMIKDFYRQFVSKVAAGRGLSVDSVDAVGQGRVWSGIDGRAAGLVDEIGGLDDALAIARDRAGIPPTAEVKIIELPRSAFLPSDLFKPKIIGAEEDWERLLERFQLLCRFNGHALAVMPLEYLIE